MTEMLSQGQITPGMRRHSVGPFESFSPNMDLRVLTARQGQNRVLVYVDHHEAAYRWAEQTRILATGIDSTELVCVHGIREESRIADASDAVRRLPLAIDELLSLRVESAFLHAIEQVSPEWQSWLLEAYYSQTEALRDPPVGSSLVYCPLTDSDLTMALSLRIPAWRLFMHPVQREAVQDTTSDSIALTGGPGTGKTTVLLNRLLGQETGKDNHTCSILLTYSRSLAHYLINILKTVEERFYYVFPIEFLARGGLEKHSYGGFCLQLADDDLYLECKGTYRKRVEAILVDELQDTPKEALRMIENLLLSGFCRVVVAGDLDQSIFRANQQRVMDIISLCERHYELIYSYRSTRQILEKASDWLVSFGAQRWSDSIYGLSGPAVSFTACSGLSDQVDHCVKAIRDMRSRYRVDDIALIYCQYYNPSFSGVDEEEQALKTDPDLRRYYRFASIAKGREYFAGVVFISKSFLARDAGQRGNRLRANTLYVALTRFRDEVRVIYPNGCAIEDHLSRLVNE
jgi:hypothetical protein